MNNFVLLDTNIFINAYDTALQADSEKSQSTLEQQKQAEDILEILLNNPNVKIAITPLIRYEVLRGVKHIPFSEMKDILDDCHEFEITDKEGTFASKIFRQGNYGGANKNINKYNFDIFHYAVADINDLDWQTLDIKDWQKIDDVAKLISD